MPNKDVLFKKKGITKAAIRNNSPFKIPSQKGIVVKCGTDSKTKRPATMYVRARSRVMPMKVGKTITPNEAEELKHKIERCLVCTVETNPHFENRCLTNVEMSAKNISEGKNTFLRYDLFVRPVERRNICFQRQTVENLNKRIEERLEKILTEAGYIFS